MKSPKGRYSFVQGRSRFVQEDPIHFNLEREVPYPYILRLYLFVLDDVNDTTIQLESNINDTHFGQYPEDLGRVSQETKLPKFDANADLVNYQIVPDDKLIYSRAIDALGAKKDIDCTVEAQIGEYNLETKKWSSTQLVGLLIYLKSGSLFGIR